MTLKHKKKRKKRKNNSKDTAAKDRQCPFEKAATAEPGGVVALEDSHINSSKERRME